MCLAVGTHVVNFSLACIGFAVTQYGSASASRWHAVSAAAPMLLG
jgi:hypothetical protein